MNDFSQNTNGCAACTSGDPGDLTHGISGFYIWCLPIVVLFIGLGWSAARPWLWIAALGVMGVGCIINARRCRRLHCYFTAPIFLFAGGYVVLSLAHVVSLHPRTFLSVVLGLAAVTRVLELPLGRYARNR